MICYKEVWGRRILLINQQGRRPLIFVTWEEPFQNQVRFSVQNVISRRISSPGSGARQLVLFVMQPGQLGIRYYNNNQKETSLFGGIYCAAEDKAQIMKTPLNRCGSGVILLCNKSFEQTILF